MEAAVHLHNERTYKREKMIFWLYVARQQERGRVLFFSSLLLLLGLAGFDELGEVSFRDGFLLRLHPTFWMPFHPP